MTFSELNADAMDMLVALDEAHVEYVVVGAHALAVHGLPRATGDLDILVRPDAANAKRIIAALEAFGAPLDAHGIVVSDFDHPGTVYQIGLPPRRIDLLTEISGVDFEEAWATHVSVSIGDGLQVPVLGRDALLKNKRAAGRPKDLVDVAALEAE